MKLTSNKKIDRAFKSPWKLKLFFIRYLPMAFLAGLKVSTFDEKHAVVTLPYKYLTKNPFRSVYFACQAMAAELSTAIICLQALEKFEADISMLVVELEANFTKKAVGTITFSCRNHHNLDEIFGSSIAENSPQNLSFKSIGMDQDGETVAEFTITWSFKPRN